MSKKSPKIVALLEEFQGQDLPAHYLGYFDCFNRQLFYEAHDVLEELWLAEGKAGTNYGFYKGLIQFAGAFVHLQKGRLRPAAALFKLCQGYLRPYGTTYQQLDVAGLLLMSERWIQLLEAGKFEVNPLGQETPPVLALAAA